MNDKKRKKFLCSCSDECSELYTVRDEEKLAQTALAKTVFFGSHFVILF